MPRGFAAVQVPAITETVDGLRVDAAPRMLPLEQVALSCCVTTKTVKGWVKKGKLKVRGKGRHWLRVVWYVDSRDFDDFLRREYPYPGTPEFDANPMLVRAMSRVQRFSQAGVEARRAKREARAAAQGAANSEPASQSAELGSQLSDPSAKPIDPIDETYRSQSSDLDPTSPKPSDP